MRIVLIFVHDVILTNKILNIVLSYELLLTKSVVLNQIKLKKSVNFLIIICPPIIINQIPNNLNDPSTNNSINNLNSNNIDSNIVNNNMYNNTNIFNKVFNKIQNNNKKIASIKFLSFNIINNITKLETTYLLIQ